MPRLLSGLLTTLILLSSFASSVATSAQGSTVYEEFVMPEFGAAIQILADDGTTFDTDSYGYYEFEDGGTQELIRFWQGESRVTVNILPQDTPLDPFMKGPESLQDYYWRGAESLLLDYQDNVARELLGGYYRADLYEYFYGEYTYFENDPYQVAIHVYSSEASLIRTLEWIQQNLLVGDVPVLMDTDITEIAAIVDGTSSVVPTPWEPTADHSDLFSTTGLTADDELRAYNTSPTVTATWDSTEWNVPLHYSRAIVSINSEINEFWFQHESGVADARINFNEGGYPQFQSIENYHESGEFISRKEPDNRWELELLESDQSATFDGAVFLVEYKYEGEVVVVIGGDFLLEREEARDVVVSVELTARPENIAGMWESFTSSFSIDGLDLTSAWSAADIENMVEPVISADSASSTQADTDVVSGSVVTETSVLTGAEIVIHDPEGAAFVQDFHSSDSSDGFEIERFLIESEYDALLLMFIRGDEQVDSLLHTTAVGLTPNRASAEILGSEWSDDEGWSVISRTHYLNYREGAVISVIYYADEDFYVVVTSYAAEPNLVDSTEWFMQNVSIDGDSVLSNVDLGTVENVLKGTSDYESEDITAEHEPLSSWEDVGLESETDWQSPLSETSFNWDGEQWVFAQHQDDPIAIFDEDDYQGTRLILTTSNNEGMAKLHTGTTNPTPAEWVEFWTSEEHLADQSASGVDFTVIDAVVGDESGSVILSFEALYGEPVLLIRDVYINDEGLAVITEIYAAPEDLANVYASFWDSVQSNGEYYPLTWTIEEIEAFED